MTKIKILSLVALTTEWVAVEIPDNVRHSIAFQLESLGVGHFSLDGGTTSMKFVGTGEMLTGNFSKRSVYFRCDVDTDNLQIRTQDI